MLKVHNHEKSAVSKREGPFWGRVFMVGWVLTALGVGCAAPKKAAETTTKPATETELAARYLQAPLADHRCKAAIYPHAKPGWRVVRVMAVAGRGPSFLTALEALCRETDGLKLPAVVDIAYVRPPSGWSPNMELRGTAVRYEDGFVPPPAPPISDIRSPELPPNPNEEPAPQGERARKS